MTKKINSNLEIEIERKDKKINDEEIIIKRIIEEYKLEEELLTIIYTDRSESEEGMSTGTAFIEEEAEEGFYFNICKRSSVFTAEILAIAKTLHKWEEKEENKNIIIYSDLKSSITAISNNDISIYKNDYIM